ncbi:MAG: CHAT domain-containing protein, partial [Phaeodactylibacter sp.]|nr:CHAT domain-containing protein [Phaeodactylibacter sp.]
MKSRYFLLPVCTILFFAACRSENNASSREAPITPPSVSAAQDHCCRGVLERFKENQDAPQPDSVMACVLEALENLSEGYPETAARCRYTLAYQESAKGNYQASNDLMLEGEALLIGRNNSMIDSLLADMYNLISINYQLQFDYTRTLAYSERAEALYRKRNAWEELVNELNNQAVCYLSVGDSRAAAEKVEQAGRLLLEKAFRFRNPLTRLNLENTKVLLSIRAGDYYTVLHWPEKAEKNYTIALQGIDSLLAELAVLVPQNPVYQGPYGFTKFSRAALLSKMVESQGSRFFLDQAQAVLGLFGGPQWDFREENPFLGYAMLMTAKALALQGRLEDASRYLSRALLRMGYPNENLMLCPSVQMNLVVRHDFMLSGLQVKGEILSLHYEKSGDPTYLEVALRNYQQGMVYLDSIRILQVDDAEADSARSLANGIISNAIRTAYLLYKLYPSEARQEELFQLAERGKSYTVRQAIFRQLGFLEFEGEMQELLQREQQLRRSLQVQKQEGGQDSVIRTTRKYEVFIDSLRTSDSPIVKSYYLERFSNEVISLREARQLLDDTTAIFSFVHGPGAGLCFVITANKTEVLSLPMEDGRIAEAAQALKDNLQTGSTGPYPENAHRLYQLAFSEALQLLPEDIRSLIIVPDGALHGLPFECLLTGKASTQLMSDYPYLMDEYSISYVYSVGVYDYLKKLPEKQKDYEIGAFLSGYKEGESEGQPLRCADQPLDEMASRSKNIIRNFKQRGHSTICKEEAGEATFKSLAGQCRILHFSAHGCAEASQARDYAILFTLDGENGEDGNLRSGEIFSLGLAGTALA